MPPKTPDPTPSPNIEKTAAPMARFFKIDSGKMHKREFAPDDNPGCYHVTTDVMGGIALFTADEKEMFQAILYQLSKFLGIEVLTFTITDSRFELLLRVPQRDKFCNRLEGRENEEALYSHLKLLYSQDYTDRLREDIKTHRREKQKGYEDDVQILLDKYRHRFCNLAAFSQELKVRFSRWYNKRHDRRGSLWAARFSSNLLRDDPAIRNAALKVEFLAVEHGLAPAPENYPWCGYALAEGGSKRARRGLCRIAGIPIDHWLISKNLQKISGRDAYAKLLATYSPSLRNTPAPASTFEKVASFGGARRTNQEMIVSYEISLANGTRKVLSILRPSSHHMETGPSPERMEVTAGKCSVQETNGDPSEKFAPGATFTIPENSHFVVTVKQNPCHLLRTVDPAAS